MLEQKCQKFEILDIGERIKPFYGDVNLRASQRRVCMELLNGRHTQSTALPRYDVFFSAPCGFGKSLSFVATAIILGGITVSV